MGSQLYWPMSEDFNGAVNASPGKEFFCEKDAGYTYGPYGMRSPLAPTDTNLQTYPDHPQISPYQMTGAVNAPFECPGTHPAIPTDPLRMGFSCWMGSFSAFKIQSQSSTSCWMLLQSYRTPDDSKTFVRLSIRWQIQGSSPPYPNYPSITREMTGSVADGATPSYDHHVAVALEPRPDPARPGAYKSFVKMWIDGMEDPDGVGTPLEMDFQMTPNPVIQPPPLPLPIPTVSLKLAEITALDEIRLHEGWADGSAIYAKLDRYVRYGEYRSPLYAFDGKTRLTNAQWTAILPAGFDGAGLGGLYPVRVEVEGFSDTDGMVSVGPPVPLAVPTGVTQEVPRDLPLVRSFRYKVIFDCRGVAGPLTDTPVFESVWFSFARPHRGPRIYYLPPRGCL